MNNLQITFNETTYRFNYFQGRDEQTNQTYDCYGVYINGALNTDFTLEKVEDEYQFFYKGFYGMLSIKDFSILEVAKVIHYIETLKNK